jgi:hypothetical protein
MTARDCKMVAKSNKREVEEYRTMARDYKEEMENKTQKKHHHYNHPDWEVNS